MEEVASALLVALSAFLGATAYAESSPVIFSELMWDGDEYVELYNTTGEAQLLAGWKVTRQKPDSTEQEVITFSDGAKISPGDYFLIEKKEEATTVSADVVTGSLTLVNTGELVRLYDGNGTLRDSAGDLGVWPAGKNTETGFSMERNGDKWYTSTGSIGGRSGTPRAENSEAAVENPPSDNDSSVENVQYETSIVINEFLPNPKGADSEGEFIELYNPSSNTGDLSGWKLDDADGGSSPYTIPDGTTISPHSYAVFWSYDTHIALNNTEDSARLLDPTKKVHQAVSYTSAPEAQSHNRNGSSYTLSTTVTPGSSNVITQPTSTPAVTKTPKVTAGPKASVAASPTVAGAISYPKTVVIWSVLPDPTGPDDDAEFIELKNTGSAAVDLSGWQLDDSEGGSKPFTISEGTTIAVGATLQFFREETNIALNNNTDEEVRLFAPDGTLMDSLSYADSTEGQVIQKGVPQVLGTSSTEKESPKSEKSTAKNEENMAGQEEEQGFNSGGIVSGFYSTKESLSEDDEKNSASGVLIGALLVGAVGAVGVGYAKPEYLQKITRIFRRSN